MSDTTSNSQHRPEETIPDHRSGNKFLAADLGRAERLAEKEEVAAATPSRVFGREGERERERAEGIVPL
jgi:hypothetical protein